MIQERQRHIFAIEEEELIPEPNAEIQHLLQLESSIQEKKPEYVPKADSLFSNEAAVVEKPKAISLNLPQVPESTEDRHH